MIYKVAVFCKGQVLMRDKVEATTPLLAAKKAKRPMNWSHMAVAGKSIRRYNKSFKAIKDEPTISKLMFGGKYYSLLVMFGTLAEVYKFKSEKDADLAHEEVLRCIISTSAASVAVNRVLTDTTVFLDGTKGSKNSSTSPKILSGSVTDAIWKDGLTQEVTDRSSGIDRSDDTASNTWYDGSKASLSGRGKTFLATVKRLPRSYEWPGANTNMKKMQGKTLEFKYGGEHNNNTFYSAKGYLWLKKWLDIHEITATVKPMRDRTVYKTVKGLRVIFDKKYTLKTLKLELCMCGCGCYHYGMKAYFAPEWLIEEVKTTTIRAIVKPECRNLIGPMQKWAGKKLTFTKRENSIAYVYRGWYFDKDWLIFEN